jgi:hypothetical protein
MVLDEGDGGTGWEHGGDGDGENGMDVDLDASEG